MISYEKVTSDTDFDRFGFFGRLIKKTAKLMNASPSVGTTTEESAADVKNN